MNSVLNQKNIIRSMFTIFLFAWPSLQTEGIADLKKFKIFNQICEFFPVCQHFLWNNGQIFIKQRIINISWGKDSEYILLFFILRIYPFTMQDNQQKLNICVFANFVKPMPMIFENPLPSLEWTQVFSFIYVCAPNTKEVISGI